MAEEEIIQFIGIKDLRENEQETVNLLSTEYYQKIKMMLKNMTSVSVHVKTIDKGGKKRQFEIHVKAIAPMHVIEANNENVQDKWDISRSLHTAFKNLLREIEHKMKSKEIKAEAE